MKNKNGTITLIAFLSTLYCPFTLCETQGTNVDHTMHHKAIKQQQHQTFTVEKTTTSLSIPNVTLLNQNGEKVKVSEKLINGKIVLLNTIFTSCSTICSPMGANYARLQKILSQKLGESKLRKKIILLSVSVDPTTDTPQRLKSWKQKFNGQPGWTLLTGERANIDKLLKATGLFAADFVDHAPVALLGDAAANRWRRVSGLTPAPMLAQLLVEQLDASTDPIAQEN